jgi:LuxR family maltose regulon positive regulatory protein
VKVRVPPVRAEFVARPRLLEQLNAGLRAKLTLVSAPAGAGKTTLLSGWAAQLPLQVAWLSLDEGDDDEVHFWIYLIAALRRLYPEVGQEALQLLQAPQRPAMQTLLVPLLNDLATLPTDVVLILDDYHQISHPGVHEGLAFLLEHLPRSVHLTMATRADPLLPLHRLRARGQLNELRFDDLRFTVDEATIFLNSAMGLDLTAEDVVALEERTEGWIVGLQLAALSLQGRSDPHDFVTAFSGGHHYVLEYLTEEVVRQRPEAVQRFLVRTSILRRLCGPLCDALTGESDGAEVLAHLRERNIFILPLDDEHRWYRYHHLFADLLRNLLRREASPDEIGALHRRASAWHDRHGLVTEAVHHALAARDFERTADLIERHSFAMVNRGELATLLGWIEALPEGLAQSRPWLCVHQAWPLTFAGKAGAAEPLLRRVEEQVGVETPSPGQKDLLGNVAAMRAMLATMQGDPQRAVEQARRAEALLRPDNLAPRGAALYALAYACYVEGELAKAEPLLEAILEVGHDSGNLWSVIRTFCDLADLRLLQGELRRAEELCREALQLAEERGTRHFGTVGYVLVKLGEILYERGEPEAARARTEEGLRLMQGWQQPYEMSVGYTSLASILQARGDAAGALAALGEAEAILAQHPDYVKVERVVEMGRIQLLLIREEAEAARKALAQLEEPQPLLFREERAILLARVLLAQTRWDEALQLLSRLEKDAARGERSGPLIRILVLRSLALRQRGDDDAALDALKEALRRGAPEGYVRVFKEHGEELASLLQRAAARDVAPDYARKLLAALEERGQKPVATPAIPAPSVPSPLAEPLTDRELEVLQHLGVGASNRQIADALVITLNTVKKHTSNIYGKLGVSSRTQAVVRAQELGLL